MNIKSCPWCDEIPKEHTTLHGGYWLECENYSCPVQPVSQVFSDKEKLIRMWNKGVKRE